MRVRKDWVDFIRAAAIIMVVVQHTVGNATGARMFVSFLTLSAVPAFVVLMGYTKALSICSFYRRKENKGKSILTYTCKAMLPVLCAYLIANVVYMIEEAAGYLEYNLLWNYLLNFGAASGPLYFIRYFVLFSLWAPVLYVALAMMNRIPNIVFRRGCAILFLGAMWFLGYYGNQMVFGSSYLFLYVLGMMPVVMPLHHWERRSVCILGVPLCAGGGYSLLAFLSGMVSCHDEWNRLSENRT